MQTRQNNIKRIKQFNPDFKNINELNGYILSGYSPEFPIHQEEKATLTDKENKQLCILIELMLLPYKIDNFNKTTSSYKYKHIFENLLGYYISNYDFKFAMKQVGFTCKWNIHYTKLSPNCYYRISKQAIQYLSLLARTCLKNNCFFTTKLNK